MAEINIHLSMERIRRESPIIAELELEGHIKIVGGVYDVETGMVTFFDKA